MKKLFVALFILLPCVLTAVIFITPDNAISENENRPLKTRDKIEAASFQTDVESFLSDQFILRDDIVLAKAKISYAFGKRDINGCYICKDRLIQKITDSDIDVKSCERYADRVNILAENINTCVIYVPSACVMLSDSMPDNAQSYDYDALYNNLSSRLGNADVIDVRAALADEGSYYMADHHWTAEGAYSVYRRLCGELGISPCEPQLESVTDDFHGTLYSKALVFDKADTIKAPTISDNITVTADGSTIPLYDTSALNTKDKYNYFEGGNHGIVTIENNDASNDDVLLVLKDSFANSFVPYLIGNYHKIIMLDERYTYVTPKEIADSENVTQILIIKEIIS